MPLNVSQNVQVAAVRQRYHFQKIAGNDILGHPPICVKIGVGYFDARRQHVALQIGGEGQRLHDLLVFRLDKLFDISGIDDDLHTFDEHIRLDGFGKIVTGAVLHDPL